MYEIDAAVEQVMDEALHKTNIDPELAHVMTLSEWRVRGELDDKLIQARRRHYIMTNQKIETDLTFQNYCHKHHLINPEDTMTKETAELSGQTAYPGTVQGPVRLIHNRDDLRTIKKGEILVAIMTNATYTPYFKKVKAIITDEGGVTCHAAIVARELKKPCIIGTKNATKVLNDGDLIEVDAHQGVVKLIERAE